MISLQRRFKYGILASLFIISTLVLQLGNIQPVSAATRTWDGGGSDNKFSTAANWSTDTAPVTGDIITFGPLSGGTNGETITLINDLTSVKFAGLLFGSGTGNSKTYSIDTITFSNNPTFGNTGSGSAKGSISFFRAGDDAEPSGVINGDANINMSVSGISAVFHVAGNLTSGNGVPVYVASGSTVGGNLAISTGTIKGTTVTGEITLPDSTKGIQIKGGTQTISNALTVNQRNTTDVRNQLAFGNCATEPNSGSSSQKPVTVKVECATYGTATYTLSGGLTLNADLVVYVAEGATVNFTGSITTNGHKIIKEATSQGSLQIAGTPVAFATPTSISFDGDDTSEVVTLVDDKVTGTLNGLRAGVVVAPGGLLKGTGSANIMYVTYGGTINPGNSPGKITAIDDFVLDGAYNPELLNKDLYDQVIAGQSGNGIYGVRLMSNASLGTILYDGWKINQGDQFTIIDNKGTAAVNGIFSGLPEGSQFTVSDGAVNMVFNISYVGGTGNDVVITALNTGEDPTPPNTGIAKLLTANPAITAGLGIVTAGILIAIALRRRATK